MFVTVTLNTEDDEYHDIEVEYSTNFTLSQILRIAAQKVNISIDTITSFVLVGTTVK